jgi:hypothetical protein
MIRATDEPGSSVRGRLYCNVAANQNYVAMKSVETSGPDYPPTQTRSSEEQKPQLQNLKNSLKYSVTEEEELFLVSLGYR